MSSPIEPQEGTISPELLRRILGVLPPDTVLVGGQALAFWVDSYGIDRSDSILHGAVSRDADFLGRKPAINSILEAINGSYESFINDGSVLTALLGEVTIPVDQEVIKVDVIHKMIGLDAEEVRSRAATVNVDGNPVLVMNPMDVLISRVENLKYLEKKMTPESIEQARLSVSVVESYIKDFIRDSYRTGNWRKTLNAVEAVYRIGKSSAGSFVSKEFGIDFREAIPHDLIRNDKFQKIRWPQIYQELDVSFPVRIRTEETEGLLLTSLGAKLGEYDQDNKWFFAEVNDECLDEIRKFPADFKVEYIVRERPVVQSIPTESRPMISEEPSGFKPL